MRAPSRKAVARKWRELRLYLLVVTLAYMLTALLGTLSGSLRVSIQNLVFDQYQRWQPRVYDPDQPVRIVDIDDESIRRVGRWPWPRQKMAALVDALIKANAAEISFDVLFSEEDQLNIPKAGCDAQAAAVANQDRGGCDELVDGDLAFARAIATRPVVLGSVFTRTKRGGGRHSRQKRICDRRRSAAAVSGPSIRCARAAAYTHGKRSRHRFHELGARQRSRHPARAAVARRQWRAPAKHRHRVAARRTGGFKLPRQVDQRQRGQWLRRQRRRQRDQGRRYRDPDPACGRHSCLFRQSRRTPQRAGLESIQPGRRPFRSCRQDRHRRRQRLDCSPT